MTKPKYYIVALLLASFVPNDAFCLSSTLVDKTGKELHELYFAPAGDKGWCPDQLGDEFVSHGESYVLSKIA